MELLAQDDGLVDFGSAALMVGTGHVIEGRVCAFVGGGGFVVAWLLGLLLRR